MESNTYMYIILSFKYMDVLIFFLLMMPNCLIEIQYNILF